MLYFIRVTWSVLLFLLPIHIIITYRTLNHAQNFNPNYWVVSFLGDVRRILFPHWLPAHCCMCFVNKANKYSISKFNIYDFNFVFRYFSFFSVSHFCHCRRFLFEFNCLICFVYINPTLNSIDSIQFCFFIFLFLT